MKALIAAFSDATSAQQASNFLRDRGITVLRRLDYNNGGRNMIDTLRELSVPKRKAEIYAEMTRRGATVLIADVPDDQARQLSIDLDQMGSLDLSAAERRWREAGWTGYDTNAIPYDAAATATEQAAFKSESYDEDFRARGERDLDVIEEEVRVGKREVERGGVRVRTYITERPVREDVTLREERIEVSRERVDEPISPDAVDAALTEDEFVITAKGEEAVIGKEARVVERVHVGKTADTRTEHIEETERRKDVQVEPLEETQSKRDEREGRRH
jgi:stress response protein YsnF